jgi:hypothetical protein
LLRIIAVDGKESSRKITLEMSYCPAEGEMVF